MATFNRRILIRVTRNKKSPPSVPGAPRARSPQSEQAGHWLLQDAKARFSELVRRVHSEGPQHVTVHGRDEVVVVSSEEFRRLKGNETGEALIEAMQAMPDPGIDLDAPREPMHVRDVDL